MIADASADLTEAISELRAVFPELRMGQLVLNLASAAGVSELGGIWDVEDEILLVAALRLLERNRERHASVAEPHEIDKLTSGTASTAG